MSFFVSTNLLRTLYFASFPFKCEVKRFSLARHEIIEKCVRNVFAKAEEKGLINMSNSRWNCSNKTDNNK